MKKRKISTYIIALLTVSSLFGFPTMTFAQKNDKDKVEELSQQPFFQGAMLGVDVFGILGKAFGNEYTSAEANIECNLQTTSTNNLSIKTIVSSMKFGNIEVNETHKKQILSLINTITANEEWFTIDADDLSLSIDLTKQLKNNSRVILKKCIVCMVLRRWKYDF